MTPNEGTRAATFEINCELESVVACAKVAQKKLAALNDRIHEAEDLSVAGTLAEAVANYDDLLRRLEDNPTTNQPSAPPVRMGPNVQAAVDLLNSQREPVAVPDVDLSSFREAPEEPAPPTVVDNLVREHERLKVACQLLAVAIGDVVRFSPGGGAHPSRSTIEVEMRCDGHPAGGWTWHCRLMGIWLAAQSCVDDDGDPVYFAHGRAAQRAGNRWLAALSEQLGVPLAAKWADGA